MTKIGGGAFTFNTIDLADVYNYGSGGDVQFNFTFADSSTSSTVVSLDTLVGLQTFTFNLANVAQVSWTPLSTQGNWIQLDNITVDAGSNDVPEPTSIALLGLGLAALFAKRRKQQ